MIANEKVLNVFKTRARQMILQYQELKSENEQLYELLDEREQEIKALKQQIAQAQEEYNTLKMARILELSGDDIESAQKRVSRLLRDVNKCITLLSEK